MKEKKNFIEKSFFVNIRGDVSFSSRRLNRIERERERDFERARFNSLDTR